MKLLFKVFKLNSNCSLYLTTYYFLIWLLLMTKLITFFRVNCRRIHQVKDNRFGFVTIKWIFPLKEQALVFLHSRTVLEPAPRVAPCQRSLQWVLNPTLANLNHFPVHLFPNFFISLLIGCWRPLYELVDDIHPKQLAEVTRWDEIWGCSLK